VDSVQVIWPNHHYNLVRHPTPNSVLEIEEDTLTPVLPPEPTPPFSVILRGPFPNPSRGATGMGFTLSLPAQVKVEVFDVVGRRVRVLADRLFEAGDHVVGWDGASDLGGPSPAGIYFYRLTAGGRTEVRRLVRISR
jgi:hypothetical protein